jgi:hypothetical protein
VRPPVAALAAILVLSALTVSACGDDAGSDSITLELPSGHESIMVIDEWVTTLNNGDAAEAARFFALPSVVQNGTPPLTLETRADAIEFNRSLPCGAKLVQAQPYGRFIAATFRLTERPGPGTCGAGVGGLARTAFLIRDGKIVQWRRLPDTGPLEESAEPV